MKAHGTTIVAVAVLVVAALAFYMLLLSPQRAEIAELDDEATALKASISEQEQLISFGEDARRAFPRDYGRLVVLGKAVPDQADTASLLVQLNAFAGDTDVQFRGITLTQGTGDEGSTLAASAPAQAAAAAQASSGESEPASGESESGGSSTPAAAPAAPAQATEAAAASLPIGATVGGAGLGTLPYELTFAGGFFEIADYMGRLDGLVEFDGESSQVRVNGRLMTVDGFALAGGAPSGNPTLEAQLMLTSYVTPSTQGLTAGATPSGPAPAGAPSAVPASATVAP